MQEFSLQGSDLRSGRDRRQCRDRRLEIRFEPGKSDRRKNYGRRKEEIDLWTKAMMMDSEAVTKP